MIGAVRRGAVLGLSVGMLTVLLGLLPFILELEETFGLGLLFSIRGPLDAPDDVVVISISGDSADRFGLTSDLDEWPRSLHGELIAQLLSAGAAVVAFDVMFDAPREPEGDRALADAIERAGNVILLERVQSNSIKMSGASGEGGAVLERRVPPIEPLQRAALATAPFTLPVVPVRVGQFWVFGRAANDTPNLPAVALQAYLLPVLDRFLHLTENARPNLDLHIAAGVQLQETMSGIREIFRADQVLADDVWRLAQHNPMAVKELDAVRALAALYEGSDSRYLNYYGPARTITTIPYHDVVPAITAEAAEAVAGKVVFVGFSERRQPEQQDAFFSVFSERSGQNLSGVEIGATAFANLLELTSIRPAAFAAQSAILLLWGLAIGVICLSVPAIAAPPAAMAAGMVYVTVSVLAFEASGLWAPLVLPLVIQLPVALLAALLWNFYRLRRQRERIQMALGYYLPSDVVTRLAHQTVSTQTNRELIFGTCLVTDAEQYTTLSEALHPEELGELMNAYYQVLVDAVVARGGIVSDIAGDSMVAVWPAPAAIGTTHHQACGAALEILRAVDEFNRARVRRELPTRIGLDSGQLLLGNIGSKFRGEYRAVGDIVNTASRLQGLNRHIGTRVLLSAGTVGNVSGLVTRPLGRFLLLGKQVPIAVLELQGVGVPAAPALVDLNAGFGAALRKLQVCEWSEAEKRFELLLERFPQDRPSRYFLAQCRRLSELYPEGGWDGIVRMSAK